MRIVFLCMLLLLLGFMNTGCKKKPKQNIPITEAALSAEPDSNITSFFKQTTVEWFLPMKDNVKLYVLESGIGDTILVLHGGFGAEHSYMRDFLQPYEQNHHLIYFDQRGCLRSPVKSDDIDDLITMEKMVEDIETIRTQMKLKRVRFIAHSMGARLAYEYLKKYPEHTGGMIIISGFIPKFPETNTEVSMMMQGQKEREFFNNRIEVQRELVAIKKAYPDTTSPQYRYLKWKLIYCAGQIFDIKQWPKVKGGGVFFKSDINQMLNPEEQLSLITQFKLMRKMNKFNDGKLVIDSVNDFSRIMEPRDNNYIPFIRKHPFPIYYIFGEHEFGDYKVKLHQYWLNKLPNVKLKIVDSAAHNVWMDQPEQFNLWLKEALSGIQKY